MTFINKIKLFLRYLLSGLKTDTIEFKVSSELDYDVDPEGWEWKRTDIIINNKSLFERLYEYERSEAGRTKTNTALAGKYIGIDPYHLTKALKRGNNNELSVWQCSVCRSYCSSYLACKYRVSLFYVEFYDFRQLAMPIPFNNSKGVHQETIEKCKWNYEPFGPFKFSRSKFFKAVESLTKTPDRLV